MPSKSLLSSVSACVWRARASRLSYGTRNAATASSSSSSSFRFPQDKSGRMSDAQRKRLREGEQQREKELGIRFLQHRRWKNGDVYSPHDLTSIEQKKWQRRRRPDVDVFDILSMNPLEQYTNLSIMSEYMTEMGRIRSSRDTGLRPVNQRRIAKAIRRSIGIGLMPSAYKHPEILMYEMAKKAPLSLI
ncbi:MAG: hypothetical protein Q9227_006666 [Pyrenula ochraceoflavens]